MVLFGHPQLDRCPSSPSITGRHRLSSNRTVHVCWSWVGADPCTCFYL